MSALGPLVSSALTLGVSGSRAPSGAVLHAARGALTARAPSARVVTGCAAGVDALARRLCPGAVVLRAAGPAPGALAARSVAVVRAVAAGPAPLWLALPGGACPAGLAPSPRPGACFSGRGSGTWAALALAVGLGVPALAFLPAGVPAPPGWLAVPVAGAGGAGRWVQLHAAQGGLFGGSGAL